MMRQRQGFLGLLVLVAIAIALFSLVAPCSAMAGIDDGYPGAVLTVRTVITDVVDASIDPNDIYRIHLEEGVEYRFQLWNKTTGSAFFQDWGMQLTAPGAYGLGAGQSRLVSSDEDYSGGHDGWTDRQIIYTPARTGDYSLRIWCDSQSYTTLNTPYQLTTSVTATTSHKVPDIAGYPGVSASNGVVRGVIDGVLDRQDIYAVKLVSGVPIALTMHNATAIGSPFFQSWALKLVGPNHGLLVEGENVSVPGTDGWSNLGVTYTPAATGIYYVVIEDSDNTLASSDVNENIPYDLTLSGVSDPGPVGKVIINGGASSTLSRDLKISLFAGDVSGAVSQVMVSTNPDFEGATWRSMAATTTLHATQRGGTVRVYARFKRVDNAISQLGAQDSIYLDTRTFLRLSASSTYLKRGRWTALKCTLKDPVGSLLPGRTVVLERSKNRTTWYAVRSLYSATGVYRRSIRPASTYYYRVRFKGDALDLPGKSNVIRVRVHD